MNDIKLLNNEELENVVGGVGEYDQYKAAIVKAETAVKKEMDILNNDSGVRNGTAGVLVNGEVASATRIYKRNELLTVYGNMLSRFASFDARGDLLTFNDIKEAFPDEFVDKLRDRALDIFNEFKRDIHWY